MVASFGGDATRMRRIEDLCVEVACYAHMTMSVDNYILKRNQFNPFITIHIPNCSSFEKVGLNERNA